MENDGAQRTVEQWGVFEVALTGPADGNSVTDINLTATFGIGHRQVDVEGFYDGEGRYLVRYMPDHEGQWEYTTHSNCPQLDGQRGGFICRPPDADNHGPVSVVDRWHFAYADGTPHYSVGTTCYAWIHQSDALVAQTLRSLAESPFNKVRMCVFPKWYTYNRREPVRLPFERTSDGWDWGRFNPAFFQHLEYCVGRLMRLGIEADIILFHPYDHWGFASMGRDADARYLRHVVARLAAYRNVWWSMANEYDLMAGWSLADWDRAFGLVQEYDPYGHLRSIHNCRGFYDHTRPWVTHASIQHSAAERTAEWREAYRKPVVLDECQYEGNIPNRWGNISAQELVRRFWEAFARGGYAGHGETYLSAEDVLWWSHGGVLHGQSPRRIAFLRSIMEAGASVGWEPAQGIVSQGYPCVCQGGAQYIVYLGLSQPGQVMVELPGERRYRVELIDPWEMTIELLESGVSGSQTLTLPSRPGLALRITAIE